MNNKTIFNDFFHYIPALLVPAFLNIITLMIFSRIMSTSDFGQYSVVLTTSTALVTLICQWIIQSVQKYRPTYRNEKKINLFNMYLIMLTLLVFSATLLLSGALYFPLKNILNNSYSSLYWPLIFLVIFQSLYLVYGSLLQSDYFVKKFKNYNLCLSILKFLIPIMLFNLIYSKSSTIILGLALSYFIICILILLEKYKTLLSMFSSRMYSRISKKDFTAFLKKFFLYGFPMIGWFLGATLLTLTDRYTLEYFSDSKSVGIYSAVSSLILAAVNLVSSPILTVAHPRIMGTEYKEENQLIIQQNIMIYSRIFLLVLIPISIYLSVFAEEVINIVLGEKYIEGIKIVPIMLLGSIIWNFSMYGQKGYEIKSQTKKMLFFVIVCFLINLLLNVILVPYYGYTGSAIATTISYLFYGFIIYIFSKQSIKWAIEWKLIGKTFLLSLISSYIVQLLIEILEGRLNIVITTIIGFLVFSIIYCLFLFVVDNSFKRYVQNIFDKLGE